MSASARAVVAFAALVDAHARSPWKRIPIDVYISDVLAFSGISSTSNEVSSVKGIARFPRFVALSAIANALARQGARDAIADAHARALAEDGDRERCATTRACAFACAMCGGTTDEKLEHIFRAVDRDFDGSITAEESEEFAEDALKVFHAILEARGDGEWDLSFARAEWGKCVSEAKASADRDGTLGMFSCDDFKMMVKSLFERLARASVENAEGETRAPSERKKSRRPTSSETTSARPSGTGFDATALIATGVGVLQAATAKSDGKTSKGSGIFSRVLETIGARSIGSRAQSRQTSTVTNESPSAERRGSTDSVSGDIESREIVPISSPPSNVGGQRKRSSSIDWLGGIVNILGVAKSAPDLSKKPDDMTEEEWEHAKLAAEVEAARDETNNAETEQVVEESSWDGVAGFVRELVIRIMLFNTVRLLLTIALLGGDAALCIFVIHYFGVVAGLGFVVVINVAIAAVFMIFIFRFNKRKKGRNNMQFGAKLVQSIQDIAKTKANLESRLDALGGATSASERDPASPRSPRSWNDEPTPRAVTRQETKQDDKRIRRTMSGTAIADQV